MLSKIQGCLYGVIIGDAIGMPVELMAPSEILEQTDGKGITGFINPLQNKIKGTRALRAGDTTDDWQLTKAICDSLIRRKKFDIHDIALAHVEAYEVGTFGWGGTTRMGMEQIKEYYESRGKSGRAPSVWPSAVEGRGGGNGVAMKIAPIGLWNGLLQNHFEVISKQVIDIGRLTHSDPRATITATVVAHIIAYNINYDVPRGMKAHEMLSDFVDIAESEEFKFDYQEDSVSKRLRKLLVGDLLFGPIENLRAAMGTGCQAIESVPFAIALYIRNRNDFRAGILEAVNSGGDTDTIASIVGAMIGSKLGAEEIPEEWREKVRNNSKAEDYGRALIDATIGYGGVNGV